MKPFRFSEIILPLKEWWGGAPARIPYRSVERRHLICWTCGKQHPADRNFAQAFLDFKEKHLGHLCQMLTAGQIALFELSRLDPNTDIKLAFQAEQTMTVTNLHSLATSATAGWSSTSVDNSSNLYVDDVVSVVIAAVNTAPANSKATLLFAYGGVNSSELTTTGTSGGTVGTEGSLTFPDITTLPVVMPRLAPIPYPVQNKAINAGPFFLSDVFRVCPLYFGYAAVNHTGMTYAASGNKVQRRGQYLTA